MSLKSRKNRTLPGKYDCNEGRRTAEDIVVETTTNKVVLKRTVKTKHDVVPRRTVATVQEGFVLKRTVNEADGEDFVLKRTVETQQKTSRRKNAIQTDRVSPGEEDLRCRTWKKRGLYRPASLICGSKRTNQQETCLRFLAAEGPFRGLLFFFAVFIDVTFSCKQ